MSFTRQRIQAKGSFLRTLTAEELRREWKIEPEPGMLYVTVRAISSRVNANYDGWPAPELEKAYASFVGRGVYPEHHNHDPQKSRGVILASKLHKAHLADGSPDYWIEILEEIDATNYPKFAAGILSGEVKGTSMGADVGYTKCSVCGNKASSPLEFCYHIAKMKGMMVVESGKSQLVWEDCYDIQFFENSHVVDPADESWIS